MGRPKKNPCTDNGGRGRPCSAFGTCFLLLHPGITDQEHPKKHAVESLKKSLNYKNNNVWVDR